MDDRETLAGVWSNHLDYDVELYKYEEPFFPLLVEEAKKSSRILEIGAGRGRMVGLLRRSGVDCDIICIDLNSYVKEASGMSLIGDARNLPFKERSFDLVYSLGVIEHFPEMEGAISEHLKAARDGGIVIITTPRLSIYSPLRWLVWLIKYRKRGSFNELMGRNLRISFLKNIFLKLNCKIIRYGRSGYFLPGVLKLFLPFFRRILTEKHFGAYLWFMLKKTK